MRGSNRKLFPQPPLRGHPKAGSSGPGLFVIGEFSGSPVPKSSCLSARARVAFPMGQNCEVNMLRKIKVFFTFVVLLGFSLFSPLWAFQNEPADFRGIPWGTFLEDLPDMTYLAAIGDVKSYKRENDSMVLGSAQLSSVSYIFYKGRFCSVYVGFQGPSNFDGLKIGLLEAYGEPYRPSEEMEGYFWQGEKVDIALRYSDEPSQKGSIIYWFKPIMEEKIADDEAKAARREGAYH